MRQAMFDVPHCVDVDVVFVGAPAVRVPPDRGWRGAWSDWASDGGTDAFRRRAVHQCLDTVAVLRGYREPMAGETWLLPAESEQRLLAQVSAILAVGAPALQTVAGLALDADLPDPGRVFASVFVLGCVAGGAWLPALGRIFTEAVRRDPLEAAAAVEAACLAPHPGIAEVVQPMLEAPEAALRSAAVRVLAFRGSLGAAAWERALRDPQPRVVLSALSGPLRGFDPEPSELALSRVLEGGGEPLVRAALRCGASLRLRATHAWAWSLASRDPSFAEAALALALHGDLADALRLRTLLQGAQRGHAVQAIAVLGSAALLPDLLDLLASPDAVGPERALVQRAIAAITGWPEVEAPQLRRAWSERGPAFSRAVRYRRGKPLDAVHLHGLLADPAGRAREERQQVYLELCGWTQGLLPRFSPYDFVGVQQRALRRLRAWLGERLPAATDAVPA
jgi:hypothetical protein